MSTHHVEQVTGASARMLAQKKEREAREAAKVEAKEKASAYLRDHPNAGKGSVRDEGYEKILKEGGLNNHTYQKMVNADKKQQSKQKKVDRQKSAQAYSQSRKDIQAVKAKEGPGNVYGRQSARDTHERAMARNQGDTYSGSQKVTGNLAATDPRMIERNEIADALYDSGHDYSHREMVRHRNKGAENKTMPGLYDEYGGYDNWYNNHSLYGEGGFTGSKDLMDFDQVMETGQRQQDAMKNFQTSDEYMSKYGQYDWAQDYNEKYGQGAG